MRSSRVLMATAASRRRCVAAPPSVFIAVRSGCIASSTRAPRASASCWAKPGSAREWAGLIDHTLLKPEATDDDIKKLCQEAATYRFASVCVNPTWVRVAACNLIGSGVPVCTVIGFPLGATLPDVKAYEARRAILDGAREVDMVINVGALKSGDDCLVEHDIRSVVQVAHEYDVDLQSDHRDGVVD